MKLQTQIPLKKAEHQIDYSSQLVLLGSCFSQNIGNKLGYYKFQSFQNPFGILFHPSAIGNLVTKAFNHKRYTEEDVFFLNERWHCFDAHSDVSDVSKERLLEKLNTALTKTNKQLHQATHIIITLGTAWVYRNIQTGAVVANCHKVPQNQFTKELLSVAEIQHTIENMIQTIQSVNIKAQFIFTVSPVRHLKDGFVENQRSKAHLIAAIQELMPSRAQSSNISYFESYELMMDELRDYRFYESDMVHPNQLAIAYIWEKFTEVWISKKAESVMEEVETVQKGLQHRSFHPDSEQHQKFLKSLDAKITYLQERFPFMKF